MKFKYKKTALYVTLTTIVLYVVMLFLYFSEINPEASFRRERLIQVSEKNVILGLNGYQIKDNQINSTSNDSWLILELKHTSYVRQIEINIENAENAGEVIQVYYTNTDEFVENEYIEAVLTDKSTVILLPENNKIKKLRLDFTAERDITMDIPQINIELINNQITDFWITYIVVLIVLLNIIVIKANKQFIKEQIKKKDKIQKRYELFDQILSLAFSDFKSRFSGSYLGMTWGILQPLSTILLFWFVFQVGFRSKPMEDVPFILWLIAGMIPWNFFYDAWFGGTNSFTSYSYIVKKVVFRIEILPFIKVLSSFILNIIFNGILLIIYILYGKFPGIHLFDLVYYSVCLFFLSLGLSYLTATLNVFMKDIGQLMGIILQFLMWMTPLMWDYKMAVKYSWIYKLNPLHYILNGYRESLISGKWFFENVSGTIWFWCVTVFFCMLGIFTMKKLKPHFADVL